MLTDSWKELSLRAQQNFQCSLNRTLELFPFDTQEELEMYNSLPSAIGSSVIDFGKPAVFPIIEYSKCLLDTDANVTECEPTKLLEKIKKKEYSCYDVLKSYFHAALLASKLTNCVAEFLPDESLQRARFLDENINTLLELPLLGLPISLKEMIPLEGHCVTNGSLCHMDRIVDYNADIVNILFRNGAIPFVRTTNPQSLMMLECESFMHGRTVNPFNSKLSSGGSSGGEGAINGIHASSVGLGSDIGGSIRCPSAFNGIYGLRTTVGRIPTADFFSCQMGSESIFSVTGPLTRSLETLELLMKTIIDDKPWLIDPSLATIEWKGVQESINKKFRIGILQSDEVVTPHPPILRALEFVRKSLKELPNVEVFDYKPFDHSRAWEIISSLYFEDGGADTKATFSSTGEPICPQTEWVLNNEKVARLEIEDLWYWNLEKQKYRKEYLKHWLAFNNPNGDSPMDAIIAPVFPGVAPKHRSAKYWGYTAQWNLLDYPVLVFPVTTVDVEKDKPVTDYVALNDTDKFVYEQYDDAMSFENAPVNLCIVGLRFTEERLLEIAKVLRDNL